MASSRSLTIQLGTATRLKKSHGPLFGRMVLAAGGYRRVIQPICSAGARANTIWHGILSEMGMVVISSTLTVSLHRPKSKLPLTRCLLARPAKPGSL